MKWSAFMMARNEEKYISESVDLVLNQTFSPSRVLVLDDGSTDSTGSILDRMEGVTVKHVKPHEKKFEEFFAARTSLMYDAVSGVDYILSVDADTRIRPDYMERIISRMRSDDVMVAGGTDPTEPRIMPAESGMVLDAKWLKRYDGKFKFTSLICAQSILDGYKVAKYKDLLLHYARPTGTHYTKAHAKYKGEAMRKNGVPLITALYRCTSLRSPYRFWAYLMYRGEKIDEHLQKWFRRYTKERLKVKLGLRSWMFKHTETALYIMPKPALSNT